MKTVLERAERLADSASRFVRTVKQAGGAYNPREAHISLDPAIRQELGIGDPTTEAERLMRKELSIMLRRAWSLWFAIAWYRMRAAASRITQAAKRA